MINEPTNEQKAILNYNGNTVVTANPGSGKTYTVVEKIGKVLHDLPSYKGIIAISFTNKASDELKKRCKRKGINAKSSFFGTIDKFYISEIIIPFASHLTHVMPEYQVVESTETEKHYSELGLITENVTKEQGALLKEALCKGKIFLNISGEMAWYIMCNVPGVRKYMQSRYSNVFIDEYQDCGKIQHDIFLALCEMGIIGVAVGDVNQAIYGFTNRFPRYLLELIGKDDFEHFELSKNHRCHPSISEYSLCLYGISKEIIEDKRIFRVSVDGNEVNIAKKIDLAIPKIKRKYNVANNNQIAILCRNNGTIKILDQAIETPHKVFAETPLDRDNSEWGRLFRSLLVAKFDQEIFPVDYAEQLFSEEYDPEKYREVLKACDIIFNSSTEELADVIIEFEKVAELVYPGKKNKKAKELLDAIIADRIELTEIDSILSENKELDDVVSIIVGDAQEDRRIVTVAVPKQAEVATEDTSQEIANIKNKEEELTKEVNKELLSEWVHAANKVVLSDIFLALYGKGVFTDSNRLYTYEEIVKTLNIPNKLYKLMHRWLTVLCNEKIVVHRDGGYCVNLFIAEQYKNNKKLWDEMYSIEGRLHYSQKLLDYLKTSSDVLPELMAGKEDPLNLLFPKGEMDVAMAAYHDNIINRIMNGLAKEEIEFLALDNRRTPIRILEVGAGVGGTSVDVIPSLDGTGAEYYFTDLSAFFLNNAREKFSGYEWVKYNIFDINKDIMEQTIAPFSVDIILAANVLHNAKNIHYVLENLKKLLKPNGTIIILEETLEAYTLLTSMEFKDGLTGFTDERAENNQTFFKREQWEGVFKEHKADIVYQFPEKGTPLEMAGQTIYVVRFKENYICPDKNNMLDELERRIPEYMIPSVITFLPRLPQTSNDKIDRGRISKWISASAEENKKVDVAELPQNDLEEQIARIWCKELNIERIGRNDNFYLSGGDSLLIAQVIARMRETIEAAKRWSWDDLLKEMMKTPTIRGVAKILSNQAGENEQDKSLVIIKEAAESSEKKVTVVFHAGTGTLTPYNSLIAYITERSQENEAVMGFTFGDEAEYLAIPTDKIFENLGKKYGRILSELGFTEYTLIGHCVGGLIALETAHYLKDKGKNVSSVTLLSTSIPHKKEETVLADLDMKIFETAVQTSLYNELLLERTFASLIDADIKKAGHQVDNDTLQQVIEYLIFNNGGNITVQALCSLTGKFAEVGAEFQRLHSMSATERMNDLYTTIERPNGQLMEHQRKMLNVLFRVFAQNFRCVSSYIPKVYTGKMRVFDCESAIANFFPSLFSEDKKTWEQYAQGEFLFDTMKGDHISCMNSPYIEENVKKILDL